MELFDWQMHHSQMLRALVTGGLSRSLALPAYTPVLSNPSFTGALKGASF